jgi:hypothetical protein
MDYRYLPIGGAPNGIPFHTLYPFSTLPKTSPALVLTSVSSAQQAATANNIRAVAPLTQAPIRYSKALPRVLLQTLYELQYLLFEYW